MGEGLKKLLISTTIFRPFCSAAIGFSADKSANYSASLYLIL
jgi:hypothetical protein